HPGVPNVNTLAKKGDAKTGLVALENSGIGSGALLPNEVLVRGADPAQGATALDGVDGIHGAVAPTAPSWSARGTSVVPAMATPDGSTAAGRAIVGDVRQVAHAQGSDVRVGGIPAQNKDFIDAVYGNFPLIIALVGIVTFLLLARAFRSLLLPAKAVLLNV